MVFHNSSLYSLLVKLIGKLEDGMIFVKKGHDEGSFEFKVDEGNNSFHPYLVLYKISSHRHICFILSLCMKLF